MGPTRSERAAGVAVDWPVDVAVDVALIPVLSDNYVFVLHTIRRAVVVDPAVAPEVIRWLRQRGLELEAVLQTHHHSDHIGGTPGLLAEWPGAEVIAAAADRERIPFQTRSLNGGEELNLLGRTIEVLAVPGHTRSHLAYFLPAVPGGGCELFCGDTLFAGGCGRLFEGSAEQMQRSLQSLAALPADTRVWCAHEYTLANLRWAASAAAAGALASSAAIEARLREVSTQRRSGAPTIPSTIALERATNLFLQARNPAELAERRHQKETWSG